MASNDPGLEQFTATDTGGREPYGWQGKLLFWTALIWAFFQLYISSNLPFLVQETIGFGVVTNSNARLIHLAFGLLLAAMAFPLVAGAPKDRIPWYDWAIAALGVISCLYIVVLREQIAVRAGLPTTGDLVISTVGLIVLLLTVYRVLGLPLVIVASCFILYVFFGHSQSLPEAMQWKGASYGKAMWHYWMQERGRVRRRPGRLRLAHLPCSCCSARSWRRRAPATTSSRSPFALLGPPARRAGQGRRRRLGHERPLFRLLHRQHRDHGHLHHPPDEAHRLSRRESRRRRGRFLDQRSADAAGDGRGGLPDLRVHRRQLYFEIIKHAFVPALVIPTSRSSTSCTWKR